MPKRSRGVPQLALRVKIADKILGESQRFRPVQLTNLRLLNCSPSWTTLLAFFPVHCVKYRSGDRQKFLVAIAGKR